MRWNSETPHSPYKRHILNTWVPNVARKRLKKVHMEHQPKESGVTVLATDDLIFKVRNSARGKEETPTAKGISSLGNINKQTSK